MKLRAALLTGLCLCQGCATNFYLESEARPIAKPSPGTTVFVTNPSLSEEYRILKRSGIVGLTDDPQCPNKVTLHDFQQRTQCGTPYLISFATLGVVPISLPQIEDYRYTLQTLNGTQIVRFHLPVYFRYSIWERILGVFHSDEQTLATALAIAAQKNDNERPQQGGGTLRR